MQIIFISSYKYISLLCIGLLALLKGFTQTSYHVTAGQGLATNQLTVLIKDRQNNMWFGSYNGLHKHEGTSIKVYKKSARQSYSLSSNEMHGVFEDRLGFIWVGTTGGLDKLDPKTGIIRHVKLRSAKRKDDWIGYITNIFQDDEDNIWVKTEVAIFILNYQSGEYTEVLINEKSGNGMPGDGLLYKSSVTTAEGVWMFVPGYIIFYDFKTRQFFHKFNNPFHKKIFELSGPVSTEAQSDLCIDSKNNLYFVLNGSSLVKYNIVTEKLDSFYFEFPKTAWHCCYSVAADYKGNVWIGFRYGGLLFFNNNSQAFTPIRYTGANSLVQSDYIYSLQEDYLQRMWVTTNNGLFIVDYYDSIVQQKYLGDKKSVVKIDYPSAIISQDDKGNIYVPFYAGGLFTYNVFSGNSRHFPAISDGIKEYGYVFTGEKDKIFAGSKGKLLPVDTADGSIKTRDVAAQKKYQFLDTIPGWLDWAFTYKENAVYLKKGNGNIYYYNGTGKVETIVSTGFSKQACVSADGKFLYLLSDNADLVKRDLVTLAMDTIPLTKQLQALNFSYANTRDMADDGNGNIWITSQNGLIKYSTQNKQVTVYTTADGLLHDFSFTLCADSKHRLWVGSMGGVNLFDAQKNTFINVFPESPDKLSNYFGSSVEAKDGHIYFLFGSKLVNINPDGFFRQKKQERLLQIDEVQVNGVPVDDSKGFLSHLSYTQNRIYVRFGLLEFAEPEKVKYFYKLQGLDKNWVELGNHSEVIFNSLPPGKYNLYIKATDVFGNEVKSQLSLPFHIHPPFWKTGWFLLLISSLLASLVYLLIKWREKNINAIATEKLKVQQLNAEQYKIKLELEQIINYFSSSLVDKNTVDAVLWDVAKNLIGRLGFEDCMIYVWNTDHTKMIQRAGYGPKDSVEDFENLHFDVSPGQGMVGYVMQTKQPALIADTSKDSRYRVDDLERLSELTVPVIYNDELIAVIDSEHHQKNFFTQQHLHILNTIATLMATKIKSIESEQSLQAAKIEMLGINEKLSEAKLEALRSQMNPHFIFNSLNAIQECILTNKVDAAYEYLSQFSKLQRMVLNNSAKEFISLSSELEMLRLYLSLESLRFSQSFRYSIDIAGETDTDDIMVPSMIIQPYVENAIWHGLRNKEGEKLLTIYIHENARELVISIDDNGIGRTQAAAIKAQKLGVAESRGTVLSAQRIHILSLKYNASILVEVIDKLTNNNEPGGTRVIITLPLDLEPELTKP